MDDRGHKLPKKNKLRLGREKIAAIKTSGRHSRNKKKKKRSKGKNEGGKKKKPPTIVPIPNAIVPGGGGEHPGAWLFQGGGQLNDQNLLQSRRTCQKKGWGHAKGRSQNT